LRTSNPRAARMGRDAHATANHPTRPPAISAVNARIITSPRGHTEAVPRAAVMPKTFYIIDGHAQIYRAYFAPFRDLSSPAGEPTKATFVFIQKLLNLIAERKPDYLVMTIDAGDETVFRKEILPSYN